MAPVTTADSLRGPPHRPVSSRCRPLAKQFWQHTGLVRVLSGVLLSAAADGPQHHPMTIAPAQIGERDDPLLFGITKCDLTHCSTIAVLDKSRSWGFSDFESESN